MGSTMTIDSLTYMWVNQMNSQFLPLDVFGIETDLHNHAIKCTDCDILVALRWTLRIVGTRTSIAILLLEIYRTFEAIFGYQNLQGVLTHKQYVGIFVLHFLPEEEVRVQGNRRSLRVLRHFVSVVQIVAHLLHTLSTQ